MVKYEWGQGKKSTEEKCFCRGKNMATILDYTRNENRTFDEFPFNNIDALVFAEMTYFQWEYPLPNIWPMAGPKNQTITANVSDYSSKRSSRPKGRHCILRRS